MAKNQVRIGVGVDDKASKPIRGIRDAFARLQKQGSKGFAIGAGAAITAKGFDLLGSAVSAVIGTLGDAVKMAISDEESQNRLAASLKANINGWDGNTEAIERNILASQRLGFDDETLRDSLTVLVGATHDVAAAEAIMGTAMDLARFKGIDLKTASEALIKVEGGQYRSLKQLGIKLRDGATATEALAAVQAVARGQAEAYADTVGGKLLTAQIKIGEQMEKLGEVILPLVAEGLGKVTDLLDLFDAEKETTGRVANLSYAFGVLSTAEVRAAEAAERNRKAGRNTAEAFVEMREAAGSLDGELGDLTDAEKNAEQAAKDFDQAIKDAGDAAEQSKKQFDKTTDQIDLLADALFGGAQKTGELAEAKKDLNELLKEGPETKSAQDIAIWKGKVAEAREALFLLQLAMARGEGPAALQAFLLDVIETTSDADVEVRALAQSILNANAAYIALAGMAAAAKDDTFIPVPPVPPVSAGGTRRPGARASGGPASGPTLVGEQGPEIVDLPPGSNVINARDTEKAMGGTTTIINLTVQGDLRAKSKEDVVSALLRAAAFAR